ncbi:hypothetical protein DK842_18040 [Chromobacterium phragmitis]|uniref:hypothetical protein n=1 Tax=Chromobacterium phragmitis TaxID=2202141 RepID=UPI000DECEDAF|nr:hypothetical protein [Chromobacterium phragmitis]AXE31632.1 hypothetical protein DK842_18040 [Chromobacterium phragmitis]
MSKKILWFIAGPATKEQREIAAKERVIIRDSLAYWPGDAIELCDAVVGEVPAAYAERFEVLETENDAKPARGKKKGSANEAADQAAGNDAAAEPADAVGKGA